MTAPPETTADTRLDTRESTVQLPAITLFSKNGCSACNMTQQKFEENEIPFEYINVETDTQPRPEFGDLTPIEYVKERYGLQMPVVVVEDGAWGDHWMGSRPDKIMGLINQVNQLRSSELES